MRNERRRNVEEHKEAPQGRRRRNFQEEDSKDKRAGLQKNRRKVSF